LRKAARYAANAGVAGADGLEELYVAAVDVLAGLSAQRSQGVLVDVQGLLGLVGPDQGRKLEALRLAARLEGELPGGRVVALQHQDVDQHRAHAVLGLLALLRQILVQERHGTVALFRPRRAAFGGLPEEFVVGDGHLGAESVAAQGQQVVHAARLAVSERDELHEVGADEAGGVAQACFGPTERFVDAVGDL
jgi:hypothetical protein